MKTKASKLRRWYPNTVLNLVAGLLFGISALAQPAFLKDGLVAYYPFNGNANDESGNNNHAVIFGSVNSSADRNGESAQSFRFGQGAYAKAVNLKGIPLGKTSRTLSVWVKSDDGKANLGKHIVNWGTTSVKNAFGSILFSGDKWHGYAYVDDLDSLKVADLAWHQLVVTYSENNNRFATYIDGKFCTQVNQVLNTIGSDLYIGVRTDLRSNTFFNGLIDDVRIYNRALSDSEIKTLYDYESIPSTYSVTTEVVNGSLDKGIGGFVLKKPLAGGYGRAKQVGAPIEFKSGTYRTETVVDPDYIYSSGKDQIAELWFPEQQPPIVELLDQSGGVNSDGKTVMQQVWRVKTDSTAVFKFALYYQKQVTIRSIKLFRDSDGLQLLKDPYLTGLGGFWEGEAVPVASPGLTNNTIDFSLAVGQIEANPNQSTFKIGSTISLKATPTRAFDFSNWIINGVDVGSANPLTITVDSAKTIKAVFTEMQVKPPVFTVQPQSQSLTVGNDVTFCATMKDEGVYSYEWQMDEQNISGATLNCYTVNSVPSSMNGRRFRVIVSNSAGTVISDSATLTVITPPPPTIATQPIGRTVQEGSNVSFAVVASGQGALVYQWQLNEQNLPGATSASLNLTGVKQNQAGRYRVLVSSPYGVTISDTVSLTVNPNPPPTIVTQPISKTPAEGTQVSLTVTATGIGTLTYQWQVNGQNIPGATSSTLVLSAVRPSVNGAYRVIVGNPYGTTISTEATIAVVVTDSDSDSLSDYEELLLGTNPNKVDTDGDGLSDFAEVRTHKSNPLTTDTDGDGYSDGIEVARDGNPNNPSVTPTGALAVFPAVDVEFYTLNGVKYQLEVSSDMATWTSQGGVVVGTGGNQNHLIRASKATQFWRLKVVQ